MHAGSDLQAGTMSAHYNAQKRLVAVTFEVVTLVTLPESMR
jgi:hypothetical protein